jgi:rhodanese-related sulfurtransferase
MKYCPRGTKIILFAQRNIRSVMTTTTVDEVKARLDAGETLYLLDVREDHERADFNIGGIHHKLGLILSMQVDELEDLKDKEVIVYCRSGVRSAQAALVLNTMGFANTVNLNGGMLAWLDKFGRETPGT